MNRTSLTTLAGVSQSVRYGYTASAETEPCGPHFLRITDIVPDAIDWESVPYCVIDDVDKERCTLAIGDIVVARTGATVGYAKLIRETVDSVFASYLVRFRIDPRRADPAFVGRLVESNIYKTFVQSRIGGAAQPNAAAPVLGAFEFRLPSRPEQERIASILSVYDDLLENNTRRITLLEQAARHLYEEWFVRLKFPGHERTRIVNGVPKGWEVKKIDEVCDTIGGGTPSTKVPEYWDGDITWVVPTDVTRNNSRVLLDSERKITEIGLKESSATMLPPETILMTSRASVGFFAIIDRPVCTNQGFINIIPHSEPLCMYLLHNLMHRVEEIRANAKGSTYPEISKGRFREMSITLPNGVLLEEFSGFAEDVIAQTRFLKKQIEKLRAARDLLLPRLMNGEIAV